MHKILYLVIAIAIIGCSSKSDKNESTNTVDDQTPDLQDPESNETLSTDLIEHGDSLTIPEFEIEMQLSTQAEQKLKADGESLIVQAYIEGEPKEGIKVELNELDQINLSERRIELTDSRVARFKGVNISKVHYEALKNKDFHILINAFSGRRTVETNLLDCEILEEPISKTGGKRHVLKGKLIGE